MLTLFSYAGLNLNNDFVSINPNLPKQWRQMKFNFTFKNNQYHFTIMEKSIIVKIKSKSEGDLKIHYCGKEYFAKANKINSFIS